MLHLPDARPTLIDGDLVLRPWQLADADAVYEACQDPIIQMQQAELQIKKQDSDSRKLVSEAQAADLHAKAQETPRSGLGDPQKAGPCGGSNADWGKPSFAVTQATGGGKIHVKVQETVYHPGFYRVALAVNSPMPSVRSMPSPNCGIAFLRRAASSGVDASVSM